MTQVIRNTPWPFFLRAQPAEKLLSKNSAGAYCVGGGAMNGNVVIVSFRTKHGDVQRITLKQKNTRGSVKFSQDNNNEQLKFAKIDHVVKYWMHVAELEQLVDTLNKAREHASAFQDFLREANARAVSGAGPSAASLVAASINLWYNGDTVDSDLSLDQWLES